MIPDPEAVDATDASLAARTATTVAGVALIGATFLPWTSAGSVHRSSYEAFAVAERLGYDGGAVGMALRWWPVLPLVVTVSVVAAWWRLDRLAMVAGTAGACYAAAAAIATRRAPARPFVEPAVGTTLALLAATLLIGASCSVLLSSRWRRRGAAVALPPPGRPQRSNH